MTCKDCIHSRVCFDSEGTTRYYGTDAAANNVEDLCPCFADRSRYVVREKGEWEPILNSRGEHAEVELCASWWRCKKCGHEDFLANFCPDCGADMRRRENG